ncbi:hypothetical protein SAMN06295924_11630 [Rathayibacter rathayi NCPPB 2980 = VKM Ac-1601]|nr:hypothetical protein FB469_3146 [Rathayibacter rathayi]SOE05867.1 hypothetical protein SAMN06295924_11630 [Rathayibacter rathayi NCPPB 2980 = VKM Ac-1601]
MEGGDLIPMPDMTGGGQKTLFETYPLSAWRIDSDLTAPGDIIQITLDFFVNALFLLWSVTVYVCIGIAWWLFGTLDMPLVTDAMGRVIERAAQAAIPGLLVAMLPLGAIVAYVQHKRAEGTAVSQIAWLAASAVLAVFFLTNASFVVNSINTVRSTGSNMVLGLTESTVSTGNTSPFIMPEADFSQNSPRDAMLRKAGDTLWRSLVATPWCLVEFGSMDGCAKYGEMLLEKGADADARKDVIKGTIYPSESNDPSCNSGLAIGGYCQEGKKTPLGAWVKGDNPAPRLIFAFGGLVVALIMSIFVISSGFAALGGVILSFFLLAAGPFFAALWCIPGRVRSWGVKWAEALVGSVLATLIAFLALAVTLTLLTVVFLAAGLWQIPGAATPGLGWGGTAVLSIVVAGTAFRFRKELSRIVDASPTGLGRSMMLGAYVARGVARRAASMTSNTLRVGRRATAATARGVSQGARVTAGAARGVREVQQRRTAGEGMQKVAMNRARAAAQGAEYVRGGGRVSDVRGTLHGSRQVGVARERAERIREDERTRGISRAEGTFGRGRPGERDVAPTPVAAGMRPRSSARPAGPSRGAGGDAGAPVMAGGEGPSTPIFFGGRRADPARTSRPLSEAEKVARMSSIERREYYKGLSPLDAPGKIPTARSSHQGRRNPGGGVPRWHNRPSVVDRLLSSEEQQRDEQRDGGTR